VKSYVKSRGWLFPLKGGPCDGDLHRMGMAAPGGVASIEDLPDAVPFLQHGGSYVRRLAEGESVAAGPKQPKVQKYEYVWENTDDERPT